MLPLSIAQQAAGPGNAWTSHGLRCFKRGWNAAGLPGWSAFAERMGRASRVLSIKVDEHHDRTEFNNDASLADHPCSGHSKVDERPWHRQTTARPGVLRGENRRFKLRRGAAECGRNCSARNSPVSGDRAFTEETATARWASDNDCKASRGRMNGPSKRKTRRPNPFLRQQRRVGRI